MRRARSWRASSRSPSPSEYQGPKAAGRAFRVVSYSCTAHVRVGGASLLQHGVPVMPTPYRSRTSDLSSALFDRATPEPLPLSPDAGAARASQISGRMGWAHDGAAVLLKAEQRIEPSQQPALASCGVFDGTPQFPAAGKHSQPEPRARSPATRQPEAGVLSPEQRKILSLTTSAVMRECARAARARCIRPRHANLLCSRAQSHPCGLSTRAPPAPPPHSDRAWRR